MIGLSAGTRICGSTPEVRKTIRQARAFSPARQPLFWLEQTLAKLPRKSDTAVAIRYALSRRTALTRYAGNGELEIDNNAAERALRVVALGRKNYLFCGSDAGGEEVLIPHPEKWIGTTYKFEPWASVTSWLLKGDLRLQDAVPIS